MSDNASHALTSAGEIGGFIGLHLPDYGDPFPDAIKFQSGRAALRAALECTRITRVLVPAYICDSVIQAVTDAGAVAETYRLDDSLYPKYVPHSLPHGCALLYVNYFGLCAANVTRLLQEVPGHQLIIDNSQALCAPPTEVLATIYSPRKFVGVPDGGLLVKNGLKLTAPEAEDNGSLARMSHLLLRMAYSAREGYSYYLESEKSLESTRPLRMSKLSSRILASVDLSAMKRVRRANFSALATRLDAYNFLKWELDSDSAPLCYPLIMRREVQRLVKMFAERGIYIPTYWSDARARISDGIEHLLIDCCLAVPCDQRYSLDHMAHLADEIVAVLGTASEYDGAERRK
jgi:hypothetical protein